MKMFKNLFRKKAVEKPSDDVNWWKNPCLDDEGTYDYLVTPLPSDRRNFMHSTCKSRCDYCGKFRSFFYRDYHYFYTIDGYDYLDSTECWKCALKEKVRYHWRRSFVYKTFFKKHKKNPIKIKYNHNH